MAEIDDSDIHGWVAGIPVPDADTEVFWRAAAEHRLSAQRCTGCGNVWFPPSSLCPRCTSSTNEWIDLPLTARLHSWIVVAHPSSAALAEHVPYVVALADVVAGVRIPGRIVGWTQEALVAGMQLDVRFLTAPDGQVVPAYAIPSETRAGTHT